MKNQFTLLFVFFVVCSINFFCLPAKTAYEQYDHILAKLDLAKPIETKEEPGKKYILKFDHKDLPNLEGTWLLTKTTQEKIIDPVIKVQSSIRHCNSRLSFDKRDFKEKEVVISAQGPDFFRVAAKYPYDLDIFLEPNSGDDIQHHNFAIKAVIDPKDLTYAYTLKLKDYPDYRSLPRQIWLNGRLKYEHISFRKIIAKGYEIEYTPECYGFLLDEVKFEFIRKRNPRGEGGKLAEKIEEARKEITILPEEKEIIGEIIPLTELLSAEEKEPFKPALIYRPLDSSNVKVPGMW